MNVHEGHARAGPEYFESADFQWRSQNTEKLHTLKGDYWIKQWLSSIAPLFQMGIALKKRICSQRERILFFKSSSLWYGNSLLPT